MLALNGGSQGRPRDPPQRLGRRRPGPRRRRHRAGRQPRGGRRPDRGVRRARHRGVRALGLPAPRGRLPLRRGRAAGARAARPLDQPGARSPAARRCPSAASGPPREHARPDRRRRRQPQAALAHPRGRAAPRRPAGRRRPRRRPRRPRPRSSSTGPRRAWPSWSRRSRPADLVVVASPTYKATYTGLLKALPRPLPAPGTGGVTAVPLMLGAAPVHALAPEHGLRPLLVELGASVPTRGLYVLDSAARRPRGVRRVARDRAARCRPCQLATHLPEVSSA